MAFALLAPLPMLAATFAAPSRTRAAMCAFVPLFIGEFGVWSAESFFLPLPVFIAASASIALTVTLVACWRGRPRETGTMPRPHLVFPMLYAALSFIFSLLAYDGTWANPAYRMDGFLPLLQIASLDGAMGRHFRDVAPSLGDRVRMVSRRERQTLA